MNKQDGIASIPLWYRKLIVRRYGLKTMRLLDKAGKHHDEDIEEYGHKIANQRMRKKMRRLKLPFWSIRLPIGSLIRLYRVMPKPIKRLYWRLTNNN